MKKILFGSAAAICAAVGFSSFRTANSTGPYYFQINTGINDLAAQSPKPTFTNSQVSYIAALSDATCTAGTGYDCVVTFATNLLTSGHEHLLSGSKVIKSTVSTKASD